MLYSSCILNWLGRLTNYDFFERWKRRRQAILDGYAEILQDRFPWYRVLTVYQQRLFVRRLYRFIRSKKFHFVGIKEQETIKVLVGAAAIQLTFGWDEYKLKYFRNIYVMKDAYTYGFSTIPWAGHVNRKGIYVSWHHVQKGYASDNDGYNVGLHEMAHALEYEFAEGIFSKDSDKRSQYNQVRNQIRESLLDQPSRPPLFTEQGLTNVHEAWAESIELFFENPTGLYAHFPGLYRCLTQLLKQYPLNTLTALIGTHEVIQDPGSKRLQN